LNESVDNYCERLGPDFWAEPLNAVTNLAFIIAALLLLRSGPRSGADTFLSLWIGVIGIGSFLFHTFATRWAAAADSVPILIFILVYFYLAMRHYVLLAGWVSLATTIAYVPASILLAWILAPLAGSSSGYMGALFAVLAVGIAMLRRDRATAYGLLSTGAIFAVSIGFRMVDEPLCGLWSVGTHFVWHILNAVVLYRLVLVYRGHGERQLPAGATAR
jgi:hypothetical protein